MEDVVIVGAGPNGLLLACELALAGVRPVVLDRLPGPTDEPKANGLVGQIVRLLDQRGLYERISGSPGPPVPNSAYFMFGGLGLDLSTLPASPLYTVPVPQPKLVRILSARAEELGAELRFGHELVGLSQDADGVVARVAGPDGEYETRSAFLVGADGAHSPTRKLSGIDFPGVTYDRTTLRMAHVSVPSSWVDPSGALVVSGYGSVRPFLPLRTDHGGFAWAPMPGQAPTVATTEWDQQVPDGPLTLPELRASIQRVLGAEVPVGEPVGEGPHVARRLTGNTRIAERFHNGRVFLLGDAAHIYALGGVGLNLGMQDAINLGWKLVATLRKTAPDGLLDTYQTERRRAADRMVMNAHAQQALIAPGSDVTHLRTLFGELLGEQAVVQRLADLLSGNDLRYDIGDDHPLIGRLAPDLTLHTQDGPVRLADLTRQAKPLLLDRTADGTLRADHEEVVVVRAKPDTPSALLLRPDSHVAWATDNPIPTKKDREALNAALKRWFGNG